MNIFVGRGKKLFTIIITILVLLSTMLISIIIIPPNVEAGTLSHTNANVDLTGLSDFGRILNSINWGQSQVVRDIMSFSFIGLVIDHDNYNHTPGSEDIADSFSTFPYGSADDFKAVNTINMVVDNTTLQKSHATFRNEGTGTGDPFDILINQTAWTVTGKDWAIIQWDVSNIKTPSADLTNFCLGYEIAFSKDGGRYGVGGNLNDGGDDVDGFDSINKTYWVRDDTGTTIGVSSGISSDPITHYYGQDYLSDYDSEYKNFFSDEGWLYSRLHAPNATATDGITPGNVTTTVGWNDITITQDSSKTFTLVIALGNGINNVNQAIIEARDYYLNAASGYIITEIRDSESGIPRIEVYNFGRPEINPTGILELTANAGALTGTWNPTTIKSYGYSYFEPVQNIDFEGDTITLLESGVQIDQISYGQNGIAPDPLPGESVARRFDTVTFQYGNEWLRNASTGSTWGYENNVAQVISPPQLVLNRVLFNPFTGDEEEGYVELMYTGADNLDISGYKIVCDNEFSIPFGTELNTSNRFFVLKYSDLPLFFGNMGASGDNVYLYDNSGNLLDMVGWSSAHTQGYFMSRISDGVGLYQGYNDGSSQAAGWEFDRVPSLQITEFSVDDSNSARIEIYNPRGGEKVLTSRWTFEAETTPFTLSGTWTPVSDIITSKGYALFDKSGGAPLKPEGDTISLMFTTSIFSDRIGFGTRGTVPDPITGESTARFWDDNIPGYANTWIRNASSGPTWGAQNDVYNISLTTDVVLNRIMFNPMDSSEGYVELMYKGSGNLDISGYKIVCDDEYMVPQGNLLNDSNRFYLLNQSNYPLTFDLDDGSINGDNVYLYDNTSVLRDMTGWSSSHFQGLFMGRVPDGIGTYQGFDDASSQAAGWVFDRQPEILITEFFANSSYAKIEIYNPRGGDINLDPQWTFNVNSGSLTGGWIPIKISKNGYTTFTMTGGVPGDEGDSIKLIYKGSIEIDHVSFGTYGLPPDPLVGESTARYWDSSTQKYSTDWTRALSPSFGIQNDVPPKLNDSRSSLNEILFNPTSPEDGFIELHHKWGGANISGYKIVGDKEYIIPSGTELDPYDLFFYLQSPTYQDFFNSLNPSGDNVYLYDDNDRLLDMVGWSSPHLQGKSMCRIPDGNGTWNGYDDVSSTAAGWTFDCSPTAQLIKIHTISPIDYGPLGEILYFNLTIANRNSTNNLILISNSTLSGYPVTILDDTLSFTISEILVPAQSSINIFVMVTLPSTIPIDEWDNITVTIQSQNYSIYQDSILLIANVEGSVDAGSDQTVYEGDIVSFNGIGSSQKSKAVWPVDISGNGEYLAIGWGNNITFFSTKSNFPLWTYNTGGRVGDLKLSENGRYLVVGSYKTIFYFDTIAEMLLWSVTTGGPVVRYDAYPGNYIDMTKDGKLVAVSAAGTRVLVFNATTSNPTVPYWDYTFEEVVNSVRISGNGQYLSMGGNDWKFRLGRIPDKTILWEASHYGATHYSSAITYDGLRISVGKDDQTNNYLYGPYDSDSIWTSQLYGYVFEQALSKYGEYMVATNTEYISPSSWNGFALWNTSSGTPVWRYVTIDRSETVDIDHSGNYVVGGSRNNNIILFSQFKDGLPDWSSADGIPFFTYQTGGIININGVSISNDGKYFAAGSWDGAVYLFSTEESPHLFWKWRTSSLVPPEEPLTYTWDFNNFEDSSGDGNFTNDVDATGPSPSRTYGDNGVYNVTLKVTDGSGSTLYDTSTITVNNINPTINPIGPFSLDEGVPLIINSTASDFGSDDLTFTWNWGDGTPDNVTIYYNDGLSPDPYPSPDGVFPFSVNDNVLHIYSFPGVYTINLTVEDDDGGIAYYTTQVTVSGTGIYAPKLYIDVSSDGNDAILYWDAPPSSNIDHYLIYRSTSQVEFDFNLIWVDTSFHQEPGESSPIPLRTMWNDTNANLVGDTNYEEQYYYIIRAVSNTSEKSRTSRTVGKWTRSFPEGLSSFSLPLEPLEVVYADDLTTAMNAQYIRYMDSVNRTWLKHNSGDGPVNNSQIKLGEGYEVKFGSQSRYTFCGLPGAMIYYNEDTGFSGFDFASDAGSLEIRVEPNGDLNVSWQEPASMGFGHWYEVYYSNTRDGFFGIFGIHYDHAGPAINFGTNFTTVTGLGARDPGARLYIMVVPYNASGARGSSTYSIGIWTEKYISGYDTFGIPLKLNSDQSADWYCENIPDTVGINYFVFNQQRWGWHSTLMPMGAFDPLIEMVWGYQVSTSIDTKYTFIGI
jgi:hypothetical protein